MWRGGRTEQLEYTKKVLLVGDGAVGKTSLVRRYVHDLFADRYIATIGTKTTRKEFKLEYEAEDVCVTLDLGIWDILGQKGIEKAHQLYFEGAHAYIVVCDLTRADTLAAVPEWAARVHELCGKVPGVLAANKVDLVEDREARKGEVTALADGLGVKWFWNSAKSGENVEMLFYELGTKICEPIVTQFAQAKAEAAGRAGRPKKKFAGLRR